MKKIMPVLLSIIILLLSQPAALAANGQTPSGVPIENIEEFIDKYVADYVGVTSPGVAVVIVQDGKIAFSKGYGFSDVENHTPVDPSKTIFEYGSVSKLFVYTAIMRLVEDGKLNLQTDIRTYLPDGFLKKLRYNESITLMHVMNHTTGFEDYLFDVVITSNVRQGFEETLQTGQPEQVYRPGTVSAYSNYAVALAAYIVQGIVGQEFYDYLMDTVFLPTGMESTSAHPMLEDKDWLTQNKATGYFRLADGGFKKGDWSYIPLYPVGSINGTADDLARFGIALMPEYGQASTLSIKTETLDEMFTQSHAMGPGLTGFSHGFIEFDGIYRGVGHGGNTAYFTAQINIVPEERFGVIILTNAASEMDLTQGLTKALLGENPKVAKPYEGSLPDTSDVVGTYISARRAHNGFLKLYGYLSLLHVRSVDSGLIELRYAGQSAKYIQTSPHTFTQVEANGAIFAYNFSTVYFDVRNGTVQRVSGDFIPLPSGHSLPWLLADGIIAFISILFLLFTPVFILIFTIIRRKKNLTYLVHRILRFYTVFLLSGTALLVNNAILILRMLINNFRSYSEVSPHILLNFLFVSTALAVGVVTVVSGKAAPSKKRTILFVITTVLLLAFIAILWKWQFFNYIL